MGKWLPAVAVALGLLEGGAARAQSILYTYDGPFARDDFGAAVAGAGDVDGDGFADLIVGAPDAGSGTGLVTVFSGRHGAPLFALAIGSDDALFGSAVDGVGDLDGDGFGEILAGSPGERASGVYPYGAARIFSGVDGAQRRFFGLGARYDSFGAAVAGLGDVDGDTVPDFAIGVPGDDVNGSGSGSVQVISGADGTGLHFLIAEVGAGSFGASIASAGDVDLDGVPDIIVGASSGHSAHVFSGGTGAEIHVFQDGYFGDGFGAAVSGAGDVNGDDTPDLIVGAPAADGDRGAAWVYSGRTGVMIMLLRGDDLNDRFGSSVVAMGDLDGDAFADFAVGADQDVQRFSSDSHPGYVRLFSGRTGTPFLTVMGEGPGDHFGAAMARVGDMIGNGRAELAVGAPDHDGPAGIESGKVYVYTFPPCVDEDGDGYGESPSIYCDSPRRDCDDGDAGVNPGAMERCANGVDDDCDGRVDVGDDDDGDGVDRLCGGDCDDDDRHVYPGAEDVCNGVDDDCDGEVDEDFPEIGDACRLVFNHCPAEGVIACAGTEAVSCYRRARFLYEFRGDDPFESFGSAVAPAGDVNGDGFDDVIVGAEGNDGNGDGSGAARVFSGKTGQPLHTFVGDTVRDGFGDVVAGVGDLDEDGFDDVAIRAAGADPRGRFSGLVRVLSGRTGTVLRQFDGSASSESYGSSISGVGDFNGDGVDDMIVGTAGTDVGGRDSGSAQVFSGATGDLLFRVDGETGNDLLGGSVSGAGDVDADGFADVIIGARLDDDNGTSTGSARVISGGTGEVLYFFKGDIRGDQLGSTVAAAGDVAGDGFGDLVVDVPGRQWPDGDRGLTLVYAGRSGELLHAFDRAAPGGGFEPTASGKTDVDRDGFADLLLVARAPSSQGGARSVQVRSGATGAVLAQIDGDALKGASQLSVAWAGDVDGDGVSEVVIGANGTDVDGARIETARVYSVAACVDLDCDGYGRAPVSLNCGYAEPDCNDASPPVNPGATEICDNGVDDDCDGEVDGDDGGCPPCVDLDGDGFSPGGGVCGPVDCDDGNGGVHPGAEEACNGTDDDCDGAVDEGLDADGDGFDAVCGGDCDDHDPAISPGAVERCDGVDQDCDGEVDEDFSEIGSLCALDVGACRGLGRQVCGPRGLVCAISTLSSILYTVDGEAPGDRLGLSMAAVGDIDGDRIPDLIVGAPGEDAGGVDTGSAHVASGATGAVLREIAGAAVLDNFGWSVGNAGDVDADGVDDLIVGTRRGLSAPGYAQVFSGATGALLHTLSDENGARLFGVSVAGAGDVDGDDFADLVVGAPEASTVVTYAGAATVFSGANGAVLYTFGGEASSDFFGISVSGAGDVDEDGFADVMIGATGQDLGQSNGGSVHVYSGRSGARIRTFNGESSGDQLGWTVAAVGDVDGDGVGDLAAGAKPLSPIVAGYARVYSGRTGALVHTLRGRTSSHGFGWSVRGAGDIDGDGRADVIVGAYDEDGGGLPSAGAAYLYSGGDGSLLHVLAGSGAFDQFGFSVTGLGDVNEDGFSDVAVGAFLADPPSGENAGRARVVSIVPYRDADGDGFTDPAAPACGLVERDCDDQNAAIHPGGAEICHGGVDEDCDGLIDGADPDCAGSPCRDLDGDGYATVEAKGLRPPVFDMECGFLDCDDSDPTVHPFAPEIRNDGIDQNCNGALRCGTLVEGGGDAMTATRAAWPHDMLVMGTVAMFVWRRARRWRTKR